MSKDRMKDAAIRQVQDTAPELPGEHREEKGRRRQQRTERLVIRMSKDELRRTTEYCEMRNLPVSTWARSELLDAIRKA
ncbi:hypothetical protein ES705_40526 [subsurface metagenome]